MSITYEITDCPVCGAQAPYMVADEDDIRAEIETLWALHTDRDDVAVPIDRLLDRLAFSQPPPLAVVRCRACGLLFRNPRERFVEEIYAAESHDEAQLLALQHAQRNAFDTAIAHLTELNGGTGTGIEVGSYVGAFLAAAGAAGWSFEGVDVNTVAVAFLQRQGLRATAGGIEDAPLRTGGYDVVAFWNCFDQLPEPLPAARAAHERLRPGGVLALRVPNGEFYTALRQHLDGPLASPARALLAEHNFLGFPYRHGFTRQSLRHLLARTGFGELELNGTGVLPVATATTSISSRLRDAAEQALRPLAGAPWLEVYARRR